MFCEGHALSFVLQLVDVKKEKKEILQRLKLLPTSVAFYVGPTTPFLVLSVYMFASFLLREEKGETIKITLTLFPTVTA